jgi:hypothetical protein
MRCMRNKFAAGFLVANGIVIVSLIVLQSFTDEIGVPWLPWVCENVSESSEIPKIDPFGFVFLIMFVVIMLIQALCMIVHRIGTFLHVMSITDIVTCRDKPVDSYVESQVDVVNRRRFTSTVSRANFDNDDSDSDSESDDEYDRRPLNRPSRISRVSVLPPVGGRTRNVSRYEPDVRVSEDATAHVTNRTNAANGTRTVTFTVDDDDGD